MFSMWFVHVCLPFIVSFHAVAKLQTDIVTIKPGDTPKESEHQIHSISLHTPYGSTSILAAHMNTLTLTHDHNESVLDPEMGCDVIDPADPVQRLDVELLRKKRVQDNSSDEVVSRKGSSTGAKIMKAPIPAPVKKAASAAAFFGNSNGTSSKSKVKVAKEKENNGNTDTAIKSKSETLKVTTESKREISKTATTVTEAQKKGNADDFVGDEDEDDEFLEEEEERKKRVAASDLNAEKERQRQEKKAVARERRQQPKDYEMDVDKEKDDDEDDNEPKVHGAMDAFAVKTEKTVAPDQDNHQSGRKRRKQVLEERTFVDEKGFFRTETITVWKDVEETEEEKEKNPLIAQSSLKPLPQKSTATKPKDPKQMKQQGLMGFFKKK